MFLITAVANTGRTFPAMVPSPIAILSGAKDLPAYRCFTSFCMTSQNMASREAAWHKKATPEGVALMKFVYKRLVLYNLYIIEEETAL